MKISCRPKKRYNFLQKKLMRIYGTSRVKIVSETDIGRIKAFTSSLFMRVLLFNSALKLLECWQTPSSAVVVDVHGLCAGLIDKLAAKTGRLRIITCRPERYTKKQLFLLKEYGVSVAVSAPSASVAGFDLCLLVDDRIGDVLIPTPSCNVILRVSGKPSGENDFLLTTPEMPAWAAEIMPEGFSAATFLGALYEINREERCEKLCGEIFTDNTAAELKFKDICNIKPCE
ncbi:MAG: hypothetical protein IJC94_07120 [Oscillospiraceae bacterium]|nr:hypothetical protein [Oscillospiraceae bacterium]